MNSIQWILNFVIRQLKILVFLIVAPLLFVIVPFLVNSSVDGDWDAMMMFMGFYMCLGPFACAFWMVIICHLPSVRQWRREGRNCSEWREAQGGLSSTLGKSFGFMFLGFFGSIVTEVILLLIRRSTDVFGSAENPIAMFNRFYCVAPFAVFAPLLFTLVYRHCKAAATTQNRMQWREDYRQELLQKGMEVPEKYRAGHVNDPGYPKFLCDLHAVWAQKDASFLRTAGVKPNGTF